MTRHDEGGPVEGMQAAGRAHGVEGSLVEGFGLIGSTGAVRQRWKSIMRSVVAAESTFH
jgi:hypothetical protein